MSSIQKVIARPNTPKTPMAPRATARTFDFKALADRVTPLKSELSESLICNLLLEKIYRIAFVVEAVGNDLCFTYQPNSQYIVYHRDIVRPAKNCYTLAIGFSPDNRKGKLFIEELQTKEFGMLPEKFQAAIVKEIRSKFNNMQVEFRALKDKKS